MRLRQIAATAFLASSVLLLKGPLTAQTADTSSTTVQSSLVANSSTPATTLLTQSLAALKGQAAPSDVTLSGTARRIAGSGDDTGSAIFKAIASGAGRTDINLASGQRSEASDLSAGTAVGNWSGPDGVPHPIATHNLFSEPAWFFPAFAISRRLGDSFYVATNIGHETHNGKSVEHVLVSAAPPIKDVPAAPSYKHLSEINFYLDSATLLPEAITFNTHPDNNASLDIPVEVQFSDYRTEQGIQVPHHVQKFLNNSLFLDFQVQTVTFNTGLSASALSVQ